MGFQTEHPYVPEPVTDRDLKVATLAFGFVIGFIIPCCNTAWSQTHKLSAYTVMIWGEIIVCFVFSVICWLYLIEVIPHSFAFFFSILTCWALQVLSNSRQNQMYLKWGVAALITAINISVYCIWIPARLQISHRYEEINVWWDRCEKCIYLVVDAALNLLFMRTVNQRLVNQGLERYRPLVSFNLHPVAYLIKLAIEMALGELIVTISSAKPARDAVGAAFEGLKIAVSTSVTQTAVRFEDDDGDNEKVVDGLRKTRTPARPDLSIRLEKIRRDRKARKANEADEDHRGHGGEDPNSDDDEDVKIDMEMGDSANWETSIHHLPAHGTYTPSPASGSFVDEKL
ncbi:hypothetical protein JCM16303_000696 [Sporobolomyces ruberrimus]